MLHLLRKSISSTGSINSIIPRKTLFLSRLSYLSLIVKNGHCRTITTKSPLNPEDVVRSVDTTLTEEQKAYVEMLKKKMKGGNPRKRSPYRDVPTLEELMPNSPFPPYIPPNANELIDYALSHVPKRAGPRGTRKAKRMAAKFAFKNKQDAQKKKEAAAAKIRKDAKLKRQRELVKQIKEQARSLGYAPKAQKRA